MGIVKHHSLELGDLYIIKKGLFIYGFRKNKTYVCIGAEFTTSGFRIALKDDFGKSVFFFLNQNPRIIKINKKALLLENGHR